MNRWILLTIALFYPSTSMAQSGPCEPRFMVGAAGGLIDARVSVDPVLAGVGRFGLARTYGTALEGSINGSMPLSPEWRVMAEAGLSAQGVTIERDAAGDFTRRGTTTSLKRRRFLVGLAHSQPGRWMCIYTTVRLGIHQFGYEGRTLTSRGASAGFGLELPVSYSGAVFVEAMVDLAVTKAMSPVSPEPLVGELRPAFGFRYRF